MEAGKITKTEWLLLGMTGLFLCVLLGLFLHDRRADVPVETEVQAAQEEILPDLSPLDLNTATAEELAALPRPASRAVTIPATRSKLKTFLFILSFSFLRLHECILFSGFDAYSPMTTILHLRFLDWQRSKSTK